MYRDQKVMFEIYREAGYDRRFQVVYFTQLDEHNKDTEIARALAGENCYDGFLREDCLSEAQAVIGRLLERLNRGERLGAEEIDLSLAAYAPPATVS
jgi:hypothetical protein